jgi:hypothetical protein
LISREDDRTGKSDAARPECVRELADCTWLDHVVIVDEHHDVRRRSAPSRVAGACDAESQSGVDDAHRESRHDVRAGGSVQVVVDDDYLIGYLQTLAQ